MESYHTASRQDFVYQMNRLSKSFGKGTSIRPVLKNVNLSFYPGAKIGVLGSNGSGKSTLMKASKHTTRSNSSRQENVRCYTSVPLIAAFAMMMMAMSRDDEIL